MAHTTKTFVILLILKEHTSVRQYSRDEVFTMTRIFASDEILFLWIF